MSESVPVGDGSLGLEDIDLEYEDGSADIMSEQGLASRIEDNNVFPAQQHGSIDAEYEARVAKLQSIVVQCQACEKTSEDTLRSVKPHSELEL